MQKKKIVGNCEAIYDQILKEKHKEKMQRKEKRGSKAKQFTTKFFKDRGHNRSIVSLVKNLTG